MANPETDFMIGSAKLMNNDVAGGTHDFFLKPATLGMPQTAGVSSLESGASYERLLLPGLSAMKFREPDTAYPFTNGSGGIS